MINRLVAQNILKLPFRGQPYFSNSNKVLSFRTDNSIRIKSFNKDIKDIDLSFNCLIKEFVFSQNVPSLLFVHNQQKTLEIYQIKVDITKEVTAQKIALIQNVEKFKQNKQGLILICVNNNIKQIQFQLLLQVKQNILKIDAVKLQLVIPTIPVLYSIMANSGSSSFAVVRQDGTKTQQNKNLTQIYFKNQSKSYQKVYTLNSLNKIIGIYQNRFLINQKSQKQIEFYDLKESTIIGNTVVDGNIKYSQIKNNLLVIISNKENTDYFNFLILSTENNPNKVFVSHRATYQKGKGDFYQFSNVSQAEINYILDKKGNSEIKSAKIIDINQQTYSILYILNKSKEKIEMIKIDHSKLLKSPFKEEKLNIPVPIIKVKDNQSIDIKNYPIQKQNRQVIEENKTTINLAELPEEHKRFIESMIEIKMKKVQKKFQELEKRVTSLEKQLQDIHMNIEEKVKAKFNNQSADYLQKVYDTLTPQLQKYFAGMFRQVAGVVENGVTFYNSKIAKEAEIHKIALSEIVDETFKITEELINVAKLQSTNKKNDENLSSLLEKKKKWVKETQQFQKQTRDIPTPNLKSMSGNGNEIKSEGKVFVRADLNYNTIKKQS